MGNQHKEKSIGIRYIYGTSMNDYLTPKFEPRAPQYIAGIKIYSYTLPEYIRLAMAIYLGPRSHQHDLLKKYEIDIDTVETNAFCQCPSDEEEYIQRVKAAFVGMERDELERNIGILMNISIERFQGRKFHNLAA